MGSLMREEALSFLPEPVRRLMVFVWLRAAHLGIVCPRNTLVFA